MRVISMTIEAETTGFVRHFVSMTLCHAVKRM